MARMSGAPVPCLASSDDKSAGGGGLSLPSTSIGNSPTYDGTIKTGTHSTSGAGLASLTCTTHTPPDDT